MNEVKYLPLGSLVRTQGNIKKILIIARGVVIDIEGEKKFYDYGGCVYPEGLISDKILYFNDEDIAKIFHEGYKDEDDDVIIENIEKWKKANGIE